VSQRHATRLRKPTAARTATSDVVLHASEIDVVTSLFHVPVTANIYDAGHNTRPAINGGALGTSAIGFDIPSGVHRLMSLVDVTGSTFFGNSHVPVTNADGSSIFYKSGTFAAAGGLAGPASTLVQTLAFVFLNDSTPGGKAPAPFVEPDVNAANFSDVKLDQIVFIGDGIAEGHGDTVQQVAIPDDATRVFFGFVDAPAIGAGPGAYQDNRGSVEGTLVFE
jgi:hypothetical protein